MGMEPLTQGVEYLGSVGSPEKFNLIDMLDELPTL
jgi:hypothetical protein